MVDLQSTVKGIGSTVDSADRNLRNLEGLTKPLGERGEQMVMQLDKTIGRLDEVLSQAGQFAAALNQSDGTIGRLVKDPQVYEEPRRPRRTLIASQKNCDPSSMMCEYSPTRLQDIQSSLVYAVLSIENQALNSFPI